MEKQKGWFRTEVDFEDSFKFWFALQWQNTYIQLFIPAFVLTILGLINFGWVRDTILDNFDVGGTFGGIATTLGLIIPPLVAITIAYKGFWQFWNDRKHGRSR